MASKGKIFSLTDETSQPLMQHRRLTNQSQEVVLKIHDEMNVNFSLPYNFEKMVVLLTPLLLVVLKHNA
jgi:hypothetical protein